MTESEAAGLYSPAHDEIATLPPLAPALSGVPISPRTGEPLRAPLIVAATALAYLSATLSGAATLVTLYLAATRWQAAAAVLEWTQPRPGSLASILWALGLGFAGALIAGAAGVAGYNAWHGGPWAKWAGLVAVGLGGLSIVVNAYAQIAAAVMVPAAALLWLPQARRYFRAWEAFRREPERAPLRPDSVFYGRLPRYR